MMTSRLTAVLERTLDAKAAQATDADTDPAAPPFDPTRRPFAAARIPDDGAAPDGLHDVDLDIATLPDGRSRAGDRRRRLVVRVAACLSVVALGAGAVALATDGDGDSGGDGDEDVAVRPLTIGDPPDGWLVPAWLPEGVTLSGVDAVTYPRTEAGPHGTIPQLFGDPEGGRAIYITSGLEISPEITEGVAVRGATSSAGAALGMPEQDLGNAVRWDERGVSITALYRGVTQDEAIAMLDALEWRSDDPRDGFAPPAGEAWPLRAEATSRDTVDRSAALVYHEATAGAEPHDELYVRTMSSSTATAGYLATWYLEGEGDGTGPLVTRRDEVHEVSVHWPDGRSVTVEDPGDGEPSLDADTIERIAESVTLADEADLAALRASLGTRIAGLDPVATANTSIGAVDVHDDGGFLRLCLRRAGGPTATCDTEATAIGNMPGAAMASAEWTVDGTWYVAIAARGDAPKVIGAGGFQAIAPELPALPAETVVDGEWTVQLVAPAPDIDSVSTWDGTTISTLHDRRD